MVWEKLFKEKERGKEKKESRGRGKGEKSGNKIKPWEKEKADTHTDRNMDRQT